MTYQTNQLYSLEERYFLNYVNIHIITWKTPLIKLIYHKVENIHVLNVHVHKLIAKSAPHSYS